MSPAQTHQSAAEDTAQDWPEQLAVRIAWCYYVLGMTQQDVAARLGITRVRVNRLLAEARRRGVVRISITSKLAENVELEERLKSAYGLAAAQVVLAPEDEEALAHLLGSVAAESVAGTLQDGWTVGVGWGITLKAFADAMPERSLSNVSVVAMLGSLTRRSSIDAFEGATTLAQRLNAECFYMPGPLICDSEASRKTLAAQPLMTEALQRAAAAHIAIVSVGGLDSGTIRKVGLIDEDEFDSVRKAGAIGNFLGHYIDDRAEIVDHPLNRRVLGMRPDELHRIPRRVMTSGGDTKVPALRAILSAGLITEFVTDQATARTLLSATH
ncbi:MAG: sugar-binding transcriptional regulator [Pseudomonadota bacterium]